MNGREIEIVKCYKYLGIFFARSGSFVQTRKYLKEQSNRAMYNLLRKCRNNHLYIDCTLDMYEKYIMPIMLYGSEIW